MNRRREDVGGVAKTNSFRAFSDLKIPFAFPQKLMDELIDVKLSFMTLYMCVYAYKCV